VIDRKISTVQLSDEHGLRHVEARHNVTFAHAADVYIAIATAVICIAIATICIVIANAAHSAIFAQSKDTHTAAAVAYLFVLTRNDNDATGDIVSIVSNCTATVTVAINCTATVTVVRNCTATVTVAIIVTATDRAVRAANTEEVARPRTDAHALHQRQHITIADVAAVASSCVDVDGVDNDDVGAAHRCI
jgi:hypothetical protein